MAIINCPKCQGRLKFPDDSPPRRVKCPACTHSFVASPTGPVEGSGERAAVNPESPPARSPSSKVDVVEDFEVIDDRPSRDDDRDRKRRRDEDDDRDRDRERRRRDEDDDDDRDRKRRRDEDDDRDRKRRDDDDDDRERRRRRDEDDDRDRGRRRRDEDDEDDRDRRRRRDEDDDRDSRSRKKDRRDEGKSSRAQWEWARKGISFVNYGFYCQIGSFGALIFYFLLSWMGARETAILAIACLPGLVAWILGAVGIGFIVAGPRRGNLLGFSIALASVAAVHLGLVMYAAFGDPSGLGRYVGSSSVDWIELPTTFIAAAANIIARSLGGVSLSVLIIFAALFELARFILYTLYLKEFGKICKVRDAASRCTMLLVALPSAFVGAVLIALVGIELLKEAQPGRTFAQIILMLYIIAKLGAYGFIYFLTVKTGNDISDAAYKMY